MSVIATLLPVIILIFVLYWLFFFVFRTGKKYMNVKITHWMVIIYLIVLLLSSAAIPFFSKDLTIKKVTDQNELDLNTDKLYTDLYSGDMEKVDPDYLIKKEQFRIVKNESINIVSNSEYGPRVLIEKGNNEDENSIEINIYSEQLLIDGIDFSEKRKPYELDLNNNTLTINPTYQHLKISIASNPFPVRQFTDETIFSHGFTSGDQIIYIKAPKEVNFTAEEQIILDWVN